MRKISYRKAVNEALVEELKRDDHVVVMGEEVAQYNGAYKVTEGLYEQFGGKRIWDTPISEAGFSGLALGASMFGMRPVVEFMFFSFLYVGFDQAVNNAANCRYMSGGLLQFPVVYRGPANGGTSVGATHSHTPENVVANNPGVKVCCPATAYDAKGLMKTAIRDNDPVFVMENTILYNQEWEVPEEEYLVPLGTADIKREGSELTIVAHGRATITALQAAQELSEKEGIEAEVVDLRSIRPLDVDAVLKSVRKTNRALLVEETKPFCGVDAQIAHHIQAEAFDDLDAPIARVSCVDVPSVYSKPLEEEQLPNPKRVYQAALNMG